MKKDFSVLKTSDLLENNWNPNSMTDVEFSSLKKAIEKSGWNYRQPVIVRVHPTESWKYEIIDGAHRYKAMVQLGFQEIIAKVKEATDVEARIQTIAMNKLRGSFDTVSLASLVKELRDTYQVDVTELESELGYTKEKIQGFIDLVDTELADFSDSLNVNSDEKLPLTVSMTPEEIATMYSTASQFSQWLDRFVEETVVWAAAQVKIGKLDVNDVSGNSVESEVVSVEIEAANF